MAASAATTISNESPHATARTPRGLYAGIAFVVFFVASVVASNVPSNNASNAKWTAAYSGHGNQLGHLATGVCLVLAALSLLVFLTSVWTRIATANEPSRTSPLPLAAAGVAAACIAVGGVVQASISGAALIAKLPLPSADLLRFGNATGFAIVALGGMLAAGLSVASLSLQGRTAGVFSARIANFGVIVAVVLLAALAFIPIAALWIWVIVATISLTRGSSR